MLSEFVIVIGERSRKLRGPGIDDPGAVKGQSQAGSLLPHLIQVAQQGDVADVPEQDDLGRPQDPFLRAFGSTICLRCAFALLISSYWNMRGVTRLELSDSARSRSSGTSTLDSITPRAAAILRLLSADQHGPDGAHVHRCRERIRGHRHHRDRR